MFVLVRRRNVLESGELDYSRAHYTVRNVHRRTFRSMLMQLG